MVTTPVAGEELNHTLSLPTGRKELAFRVVTQLRLVESFLDVDGRSKSCVSCVSVVARVGVQRITARPSGCFGSMSLFRSGTAFRE